jgi:hypothetical protein
MDQYQNDVADDHKAPQKEYDDVLNGNMYCTRTQLGGASVTIVKDRHE